MKVIINVNISFTLQINIYKEAFIQIVQKYRDLESAIQDRFENRSENTSEPKVPYRPEGAGPPTKLEFRPPQRRNDDNGNHFWRL